MGVEVGVGVYVKNSAEAVDFYIKAFGLELGYHVKNEDGSFYHSELSRNGNPFLSVVEGKDGKSESITQLGVEFNTPEEVKRVYKMFCEDGATIDLEIGELPWSPCAASVVDRFGVWWYFSAQSHQPGHDFDPKETVL